MMDWYCSKWHHRRFFVGVISVEKMGSTFLEPAVPALKSLSSKNKWRNPSRVFFTSFANVCRPLEWLHFRHHQIHPNSYAPSSLFGMKRSEGGIYPGSIMAKKRWNWNQWIDVKVEQYWVLYEHDEVSRLMLVIWSKWLPNLDHLCMWNNSIHLLRYYCRPRQIHPHSVNERLRVYLNTEGLSKLHKK